jgi:hypothetical protein
MKLGLTSSFHGASENNELCSVQDTRAHGAVLQGLQERLECFHCSTSASILDVLRVLVNEDKYISACAWSRWR